jgi:hypothetical protein
MAHVFDRLAAQAMDEVQCHVDFSGKLLIGSLERLPHDIIKRILIDVVSSTSWEIRHRSDLPFWYRVSLVCKGLRVLLRSLDVARHCRFNHTIRIDPTPTLEDAFKVQRIVRNPLLSALPWTLEVHLRGAKGGISPLAETSIYSSINETGGHVCVLDVLKNATVTIVGFGQSDDEIGSLHSLGHLEFRNLSSLKLFGVEGVTPPTTLLLDPGMFPNLKYLCFEDCDSIETIVGPSVPFDIDAPHGRRKIHVNVKGCDQLKRVQHLSNISEITLESSLYLEVVANVSADKIQIRGRHSYQPLTVADVTVDTLSFGGPLCALRGLPHNSLHVSGDVRRLEIYVTDLVDAYGPPLDFDVTGLANVHVTMTEHEAGALKRLASVFRHVHPSTHVSLDLDFQHCGLHRLSAEDTATVIRHATEVTLTCCLQEVDLSPLAQPGCRLQQIKVTVVIEEEESEESIATRFLDSLRNVPCVAVECLSFVGRAQDRFPQDALTRWKQYREQQANFRTKFETHP